MWRFSNRDTEISKYFSNSSDSASENLESNELSADKEKEINSKLNDSFGDDDFKSPIYFRPKITIERKVNKYKEKYAKHKKRNIIRGQKRLTSMIQENFTHEDVHPEHLQMALALSKSEQPIDVDEGEEDIEDAACSSTQTKILGVRRTLEQFGFKSNKQISRNAEHHKKLHKKSKYQFITPVLYIRTEEDRQNLISTKISMILSKISQPAGSDYEKLRTELYSSYLSELVDENSRIFSLNKICIDDLQLEHFYCSALGIERNVVQCGHMLKDWSKISGRDITPPRETNSVDRRDEADDIILITSESETDHRGAISPDLFTSDDENVAKVGDNIDKTLKTSLNMLENLRNISYTQINCTDLNINEADDTIRINAEESPKVARETLSCDRLDNTDDILGTLEISLSKDVESIRCGNNQIAACSALLLSNLNSVNRDDCAGEIDKDDSECSNASLTQENISGIEHFEFFSDEELELPKTMEENRNDSNEICDLTLSDDGSDNCDKIINNMSQKSGIGAKISEKKGKSNGKYEILSDSSDYESYNDKNDHNSTEMNNLLEKPILNYTNVDSDVNKCDTTIIKTPIRKSQSFTAKITTETAEKFKKYASFTSPKQHQAAWNAIDEIFKRYSSTNSESSENIDDVIHISDEELNYSAVHSKEKENLTPNKSEENNLNSYSYLERYNDEFYFGENQPQTPVVHRRIQELNKNDLTPSSSSQNNAYNINPEGNVTKTPDGFVVIKTKNITPLPDYDAMSSPRIGKELEKIGVKPLKRRRAVQILTYIYETTHPVCSKERINNAMASGSDDDVDGNNKVKRRKFSKFTSKKRVEVDTGVISDVGAGDIRVGQDKIGNIKDRIEIVGDIPESDLIFERKQSKKIASCTLPLHIAWHNLVSSNSELKQNILLYEPLQLEVLFIMLKEQGYNYHMQDLLTFLDKKCITVRVKQSNRQRKRF